MEDLIKRRGPVRSTFTKKFNSLMSALKEDKINNEDIKTKMLSLERIGNELAELDNSICDEMIKFKSKEYDAEYEKIEEYREKLDLAQIRVKEILDKNLTLNNTIVTPEKTKLKLPKIELIKFGGEISDWLSFWSQFGRIHDDSSMSEEDKFQYLIQCMTVGSRAREIVDSFPPTAENYAKVIDCLKTRFGREELLVEFYVRELLALVVKNAINFKSKHNITQLYDKLESHLRSLESIGVTTDKYAAMLFPLVESCIPEDLLRVWLRNPTLIKEENSYGNKLSQLLSFLRAEVEGEERISLAKAGFKPNEVSCRKPKYKEPEFSVPTANDLISGVKVKAGKVTCIFCGKSHNSQDCFKGQKMSLEEKQNILRKNKACFTCLRLGHRAKDCKASVRCIVCKRKHWTILCPELPSSEKVFTSEVSDCDKNVALSNQSHPEVLLQTLSVVIEAGGKRKVVRALFDTGSQRSYILKSTVNEMHLSPQKSEILTHVVFGGLSSKMEHKCYKLLIRDRKERCSWEIQALDQQTICGRIPCAREGSWMRELQTEGILLTDVGKSHEPIELLIGADYAGYLYTGKVFQLSCGYVAMETYLGWVVMGKLKSYSDREVSTSLLIQTDNVTDLWKLESIGITDPCTTDDSKELEMEAMNYFSETVRIDEHGRYQIRLPWMRNVDELPSNRDIAEKRLESVTRKLLKDNRFHSYDAVFEEWKEEGFIEDSCEGSGHYLPHRGVFKAQSTTKVRPVFDASCKSRGNFSLNDCLMKGSNLLELVPSVLLNFREKNIGVIADIKKAFLQISVAEEDRKYLKFLWWKDKERKLTKVYQHATVVFGLTCSPFLLGAVIHHHLDKYVSTPVEDVAMKLKRSFYVDNCVTSVNTEQELQRFIKISTELMAAAKFELRGWEFSEGFKKQEKLETTSVLGLLWNKSKDVLFCDDRLVGAPPDVVTRRVILSFANRVFDPIGFTCPLTLCPKLLLQESWQARLSWDSEVSADIRKKFLNWLEDMKMLHLVEIPRKVLLSDTCDRSLHVFCDASAISYASAVFIRCEMDDEISVQLLMAKSRVAPLKEISIPRLELLACCIGVRLAHFVRKNLNIQNEHTWFWTDSTTALQWIKRNEPWSVFVRNRVKEIRLLSSTENWRHIPGQYNPADLPSRGCSVLKLLRSRWWEGPTWLKMHEDSWPQSVVVTDEEAVSKEKLKKSVILISASLEEEHYLSYFSSYLKTIRVTAWLFRFVSNAKASNKNRTRGDLSVEEVERAEKRILKVIQRELSAEKRIKSLKSLNIFKDEEGLLRIKTKLTQRDDSEDFKYPILLPGKHRLVELLIRENHLKHLHAGVQILLASLRERFWIINGRRTVRSVINKCVRCKRHSARNVDTAPIALPEDRVKDASVFEITGVDLAGPLHLKGGEKCWIVLYTCAVFRAIHLELVLSLSTKAFLLSLRRFIARRGRPKVLYSDNAKNFVGAENLLQKLDWDTIQQETLIEKITWKFIPPAAPWWGGFWERMVQMVKKLLRRVLGNASLLYEEMVSLLCDCESVINSRPITYLSEDPEDMIPLTPAMFLQPIQTARVPDLDELNRIDVKKRWKYQQTLRELLRKRFRNEYLSSLLQPKKKDEYYEVKPGDVVLIENDSQKRVLWPMAKVVEVYPSKDKIVRVARLKTSSGELLRPVRRLFPLEIRSPSENMMNETKDSQSDVENRENLTTRSGRTIRLPLRFRDK